MKKILFIALAVAGLSNIASAQEAVAAAGRAPRLDQKALDKQNKERATQGAKANLEREKPAAVSANESASTYKKAGATEAQSAAIAATMKDLDKRKAELESNTQLTPAEKKAGLEAVETERAAVLKKSMGAATYKKYNEQQLSGKKTKGATTHVN